jgi:predicted transcriptional regulator
MRGRGGRGGHEPAARIQVRELRVREWMVQGWSQTRMAAALGVSQPAIHKIIRRIEDRAFQELAHRLEQEKAKQTLQLQYLVAESLQAWEQSTGDATRRRQRKTTGSAADGGATVAEVTSETQYVDPRFLEEARKILADVRRIWGLDAPQRLDVRADTDRFAGWSEEALRAEFERHRHLLEDGHDDAPAGDPADQEAGDD